MVTMVVHHPTILSSHGVDENRHQDQRALLSQLGRTDVIVDLARWAGVNGSDEGFACDMTSSKYIFLGSLGLHMYYIQLVCTHTYMYIYIHTVSTKISPASAHGAMWTKLFQVAIRLLCGKVALAG